MLNFAVLEREKKVRKIGLHIHLVVSVNYDLWYVHIGSK